MNDYVETQDGGAALMVAKDSAQMAQNEHAKLRNA